MFVEEMPLWKKILKVITFLIGCGFVLLFFYIGIFDYLDTLKPNHYADFPWFVYWLASIWLPILGFLFIAVSKKIK